jgi:hypothetical protein
MDSALKLDPETQAAARKVPELSVVETPPPGLKALKLYEEARKVSFEQLRLLAGALAEAHALTEAVLDGGDLYAPGVRDFAERLADELFWRGKTLEALAQRQADPPARRRPAH